MDGAVGITQCPIPSGADFVYDFKIGDNEHGTFWWHSHHKVQRGDGLFGGFVIHPPGQQDSPSPHEDYDDVLLLIGDWFHRPQADVLEWYASYTSLGDEPVPESLQINGHGRFDCAMEMPAMPLNCTDMAVHDMIPVLRRKATKTRLRLVNVGTISGFTVMIDGATLQPIEVDGGCPVNGTPADAVGILYPGERTDLMLTWKEDPKGDAWFNVYLDDESVPQSSLFDKVSTRLTKRQKLRPSKSCAYRGASFPSTARVHCGLHVPASQRLRRHRDAHRSGKAHRSRPY